MFKFTRKLKNVKLELKDSAKSHMDGTYAKLSKNAQKLEYVEERLVVNPNSYKFNS